jgi:hypothetical protein
MFPLDIHDLIHSEPTSNPAILPEPVSTDSINGPFILDTSKNAWNTTSMHGDIPIPIEPITIKDSSLPADAHTNLHTSRGHLHRRAKQPPRIDYQTPLPTGRTLVNVKLNDEAFDHSYAALSTLSDFSNGIDAGTGLFASRDFNTTCPLDDWDLVGYYVGCKTMTVEEIKQHMYNPDPSINTGFMILFGGLAADGWNHELGTYTCATALINDPLDNTKYNCGWHKEKRKNSKGRPFGQFLITVRSDPAISVRAHDEWGISYGHTPWCNARLPLSKLFQAVEIITRLSCKTQTASGGVYRRPEFFSTHRITPAHRHLERTSSHA